MNRGRGLKSKNILPLIDTDYTDSGQEYKPLINANCIMSRNTEGADATDKSG